MQTLDTEAAVLARRNFFLNLSPQLGQHLAHNIGGYVLPTVDVQEAESIDTAKLYLTMNHVDAIDFIADTSWWFLPIMDPKHRMDRVESNLRSDQLVSYCISTINGLMEKGILQWGVPVPEIDLSGVQRIGPKLDEVDQAVIDRMEKDLTDE